MKKNVIFLAFLFLPLAQILVAEEQEGIGIKCIGALRQAGDWYAYNLKGEGQKVEMLKEVFIGSKKVLTNSVKYTIGRRPLEELMDKKNPLFYLVTIVRVIMFPGPYAPGPSDYSY